MEARVASRTYGAVDDSAHHGSSPPSAGNSEKTSLVAGTRALSGRASERSNKRSWMTVALICLMAVGTIVVTNRSGSSTSQASETSPAQNSASFVNSGGLHESPAGSMSPQVEVETDDAEVESLSFTATNFYHERDGKPGLQIPWLAEKKIAEPYMDTKLQVENPREGYTYDWTISARGESESYDDLVSISGPVVEVQFTRLDENFVTLDEKDSQGKSRRTLTEAVIVKYVRREVRTLTDEDREELFDAMQKLWIDRVQDGNGKELYGDDYADIWAINRLHFKAASPLVCDHFHDGLGFLTSHSLLSNTFEYSLQRVNPKLTLPYWDFTIEKSSSGGNTADKIEPQSESPILQESWFGSNDPEDGMVKNGRWAYTRIPRAQPNNPGGLELDVYSKLRAPWNVNDRPYLTRSLGSMCGVRVEEKYTWPTCMSHYELNTKYNDFYSWVWTSLYDPHGPVHVWLGGVLDCDDTYAKLKDLVGPDIATHLAYFAFVHRKNLFRSGIFSCEGSAEVSVAPGDLFVDGQCGCHGLDFTQGDDYISVRNQIVFLTDYISDFPEDTQRAVVGTLCNGLMNDGDHLQASSSLDPSFWMTHPTMERLFLFKRLTGTLTDLSWPDEDVTYVNDDGEVVQEVLSLYDESCMGHRGKDVFPFGLASDAGSEEFMARTQIRGDNDAGNTLNNREILELLDPRADSFNYIYDNFQWKHCLEDGVDFNDTWGSGGESQSKVSETKARPERPTFKEGQTRFPRYNFMLEVERANKEKAKMKVEKSA